MSLIENIFILIGASIFIIYFILFNRTMKLIDLSERKRYISKVGSKLSSLTIISLLGALFYINGFIIKLFIAITIVIFMFIETIRHHKKLKELNFNETFEKRLFKISSIPAVGVLLILISVVMHAKTT